MAANILVVEDDADINEIISTQLSRNGHTCTQAFSGTEALMRLGPNGGPLPYDLVICDLMLPGVTGEQIIDSARGADTALPVIVISARTSTADRVELLKLGADDYLTKPFDLDELAARVEVQLRHRSKQRGPRTNKSRTQPRCRLRGGPGRPPTSKWLDGKPPAGPPAAPANSRPCGEGRVDGRRAASLRHP